MVKKMNLIYEEQFSCTNLAYVNIKSHNSRCYMKIVNNGLLKVLNELILGYAAIKYLCAIFDCHYCWTGVIHNMYKYIWLFDLLTSPLTRIIWRGLVVVTDLLPQVQ